MLHQELILIPQASQISLISLEILHNETINNHHNAAVEIKGSLNQDIFFKALHAVVIRHPILCAKLGEQEGRPVLKINIDEITERNPISFKFIDASHSNFSSKILDLYENLKVLKEESLIELPFNLDKGPLCRGALIMMGLNHYHFLIVFNHIIIDGISVGIFFEDLSAYYNTYLNAAEKELALIKLPAITDLDFSLEKNEYQNRIAYWKKTLQDLNPLSLQTDYLPQKSFRFLGKRLRFTLEKRLIDQMESNLVHATLFQKLFSCLYLLLNRYSGATNFCIGITSANRQFENINPEILNRMMNCFFNSIPIRINFTKNNFKTLVTQVKKTISEAVKHQLPINEIYEKAISVTDKTKNNIALPFNILFVLNQHKPQLTLAGTEPASYVNLDSYHSKFSHFAINLDQRKDGSYDGFIEFNPDLFTEATMKRLIGHFKKIIAYTALHPNCKINNIPLLLKEEKFLIQKYNDTYQQLPFRGCVHNYFQQKAKKYPLHRAIFFHHADGTVESMTLGELEEASTRLAVYLIKRNVSVHEPIGICLTRSKELYIAILGIMKAQCVFVPLENEISAKDLINYKIAKTDLKVVITDNNTSILFDDKQLNLFDITTLNTLKIKTDIILPDVSLRDPVHIMFTSGTTGDPKGVVSTHHGLANLLGALILGNPEEDSLICTSSDKFDAFLYNFLELLAMHSGKLHLCFEKGRFFPPTLNEINAQQKINFGVFLPGILAGLEPNFFRRVIIMGEPPHEDTIARWRAINPKIKFEVGYGLTEVSICLSTSPLEDDITIDCIGRPIINMEMLILDQYFRLCPLGVPGEIYVKGPGIADGYLKDSSLTNQKFIFLAFNPKKSTFIQCEASKGERFYRTGDRGCYVSANINGLTIKYLGREDGEFKLHGVRLNKNVIEAILRTSPLIKDVALLLNQQETALIAYIVPSIPNIPFEDIKKQIDSGLRSTLLPRIAYPSTIVTMNALPYTQNGKIDLHQLPRPAKLPLPLLANPYEKLQNQLSLQKPINSMNTSRTQNLKSGGTMQDKLQTFWSEILGKPKDEIPLTISFADLGGDSYTLVSLILMIKAAKKELDLLENCSIQFKLFSKEMTIETLALALKPYQIVKSADVTLPFNATIQNNSIFLSPLNKTQVPEKQISVLGTTPTVNVNLNLNKNNLG